MGKCKPLHVGPVTRWGTVVQSGCAGHVASLAPARCPGQGRAVQVNPIIPKLKPPGTKLLKLNCDELLSTSAITFNSRRYTKAFATEGADVAL